MLDYFLFGIFPYIAIVLAVIVTICRFKSDRYSITTKSSQFLENKVLFFASNSWHYGILIVLIAHIFAVVLPGPWEKLIGDPMRLYAVEITGFGLGLLSLLGIILLIVRRLTNPKLKAVTTKRDKLVGLVLLLQVLSGVAMAAHYRFGASWYVHTAVPWIWSLVKLSPEVSFIANLPHMVKFHFFNAFFLIALIPFTKLVHVFTLPLSYLLRPPQVVIWNRFKPSKLRGES